MSTISKTWHGPLCWQSFAMSQKSKQAGPPSAWLPPRRGIGADHGDDVSRLMVLANLLKRGAILRYKRLAGFPR